MDEKEENRTIYNAGPGEIFFKNFLAGLGRGLGSLFVYLIFLVILGVIAINFVLPKVLPLITGYTDLLKSLEGVSNLKSSPANTIPGNPDLQQLFGK